MSAIQFAVAAKEAEVPADEDVVEVPIDGVTYYARRLTVGQSAALTVAMNGDGTNRAEATFNLIEGMLGHDALVHIQRLIWERRLDFDDLIGGGSDKNPDGGLIDLIIAEFTSRPTQPSTDSSPTPVNGGRKSGRRSPGKGSIRSDSPSTPS